ncbi:MAG: ArsR/SmtB family transcription factor [Solirubrobacteraceae bacterium]
MNTEDPRYAKALRHPLRARILTTLNEREATPTELASMLDASVGTVAYHVRTLYALGLIELTGETRVRGAVAHHYRAVQEPAEEDVSNGSHVTSDTRWVAVSPLDPQVCPVARVGNFDDAAAHATHASLRLDSVGWKELSQACRRLLEQADRIAQSSAERLAQNPLDDERDAGMVLFMFEAKPERGEAVS